MKTSVATLLSLILILSASAGYAQRNIFSGKVTDADGKLVPGARIQITKAGNFVEEIQADKDGLYYSALLWEGNYNIDIHTDKADAKVKRVFLEASDDIKRYYNLKMTGKKIDVEVTEKNPFMDVRLSAIANDNNNRWDRIGSFSVWRLDSTGKMTQTLRSVPPPERPLIK